MNPILIVGAALIGLPILLHLILRQEPKRLPFPALRFLKQKQRVNQRKMRLKHFLLLLLRCLLIALFCLTLFQPRIPSQGLNLAGELPVAAVLVLDTSPSMGYAAEGKTRLEEARRRALELLDELPSGSKVAVVDPAEPFATWELSVSDARRRIEDVREPRGGGPPLTTALATAYQLLRTVDEESDSADKLPRLVVVFSDRAAASWDGARADDLKRLAGQVPEPAVAHLFVDVGIDKPANVAILSADLQPQIVPANRPVPVTVTLQAAGPDVPSIMVRCTLDGNADRPERKEESLTAGTPKAVTFTFKDLKPGLHQAEITLETPDNLPFDNTRHVTFRVGEARKILTIADDPADADFWKLAHEATGEFAVDVKTPDEVRDFGGYDFVCLLSVSDPSKTYPNLDGRSLWDALKGYVERGGDLLVMPGSSNQITLSAYDPAAVPLMPGKLVGIENTRTLPEPPKDNPKAKDRRGGVEWHLDDSIVSRHPLLSVFKEWKLRGNVDFVQEPRRAWKYWLVEADNTAVVVKYDSDDDPAKRHPAVIEKLYPSGGKVLLLTTRMDTPKEPSPADEEPLWHDYWRSSWAVVFPNLLARYLAGDTADSLFNFATGQAVSVPLPRDEAAKRQKLLLEGPGISSRESSPTVDADQTEYRLPPAQTLTAGSFVLRTEDNAWREGFSLNAPGEESNLEKVPEESIEAVMGENSLLPVEKELELGEILESRFDPEIKLFPWLLIALLLLFALEGLIANRFYQLRNS